MMSTWDDHDFGANNEGKYYSQRKASQVEFLRHFDIPILNHQPSTTR